MFMLNELQALCEIFLNEAHMEEVKAQSLQII